MMGMGIDLLRNISIFLPLMIFSIVALNFSKANTTSAVCLRHFYLKSILFDHTTCKAISYDGSRVDESRVNALR